MPDDGDSIYQARILKQKNQEKLTSPRNIPSKKLSKINSRFSDAKKKPPRLSRPLSNMNVKNNQKSASHQNAVYVADNNYRKLSGSSSNGHHPVLAIDVHNFHKSNLERVETLYTLNSTPNSFNSLPVLRVQPNNFKYYSGPF